MPTGAWPHTLERWHRQLRDGDSRLAQHLAAAEAALPADPIAPLRRQALALLRRLSQSPPSPDDRTDLALLLRGWGDLAVVAFPGLARHHYETAWSCLGLTTASLTANSPTANSLGSPSDDRLALRPRLANLAGRRGWSSGATCLAEPAADLPPWFETPCYGLGCGDCQELLQQRPADCPQQQQLELCEVEHGRIWIECHNPWRETYGVAATTAAGELLAEFCRCYPWGWPGCRHAAAVQELAVQQLAWHLPRQGQAQPLAGPVLAVADLSAELYYHFQLELLPRLGLAWRQLSAQEPQLRLWHNGGDSPRVQEALGRLGIPPERVLHARSLPHIQAERLWLANWPCPFGAPGPWVVEWLRELYGVTPPNRPQGDQVLWLPRGGAHRRPLLQERAWIDRLAAALAQRGLTLVPAQTGGEVAGQLRQVSGARAVLAPHGGAMVNLVAGTAGARVLELVNPAYAPPYFATLGAAAGLRRWGWAGRPTAEPLSRLLYSGPLELPIDLGPPPESLQHPSLTGLLNALDP
jgi:hypothetical protein